MSKVTLKTKHELLDYLLSWTEDAYSLTPPIVVTDRGICVYPPIDAASRQTYSYLRTLFRKQYGKATYPFGQSAYFYRVDNRSMHSDPARREWVARTIQYLSADVGAECSKKLRDFYVWWLGRVRAKDPTIDTHGLCYALCLYRDAQGMSVNEYSRLRTEQRSLFKKMYGSTTYPFGRADWSNSNPMRLRHAELFAVSAELRQFYRDWLKASAARRPSVKKGISERLYEAVREEGLCYAIRAYTQFDGPNTAPIVEQSDMFHEIYGSRSFPFHGGDVEGYFSDNTANRSPKRRKHVKRFAMVNPFGT